MVDILLIYVASVRVDGKSKEKKKKEGNLGKLCLEWGGY